MSPQLPEREIIGDRVNELINTKEDNTLEILKAYAKALINKLAAIYQSDSMQFDYSVLEIPEKDLTTYIEDLIEHTYTQAIQSVRERIKELPNKVTYADYYEAPDFKEGYMCALDDLLKGPRST